MKRWIVWGTLTALLVVVLELLSTLSARTLRQALSWIVLGAILWVPIGLWLIWRFLNRMDTRQTRFEKWLRLLVGKDDNGDGRDAH